MSTPSSANSSPQQESLSDPSSPIIYQDRSAVKAFQKWLKDHSDQFELIPSHIERSTMVDFKNKKGEKYRINPSGVFVKSGYQYQIDSQFDPAKFKLIPFRAKKSLTSEPSPPAYVPMTIEEIKKLIEDQIKGEKRQASPFTGSESVPPAPLSKKQKEGRIKIIWTGIKSKLGSYTPEKKKEIKSLISDSLDDIMPGAPPPRPKGLTPQSTPLNTQSSSSSSNPPSPPASPYPPASPSPHSPYPPSPPASPSPLSQSEIDALNVSDAFERQKEEALDDLQQAQDALQQSKKENQQTKKENQQLQGHNDTTTHQLEQAHQKVKSLLKTLQPLTGLQVIQNGVAPPPVGGITQDVLAEMMSNGSDVILTKLLDIDPVQGKALIDATIQKSKNGELVNGDHAKLEMDLSKYDAAQDPEQKKLILKNTLTDAIVQIKYDKLMKKLQGLKKRQATLQEMPQSFHELADQVDQMTGALQERENTMPYLS